VTAANYGIILLEAKPKPQAQYRWLVAPCHWITAGSSHIKWTSNSRNAYCYLTKEN